jgi:hypothetical protein
MSALFFKAIYKLTMNSNKLGITKEVMATKVIPYLVPLSIENGLSLQQVFYSLQLFNFMHFSNVYFANGF